jgi:hypothetical protein
VCLITQSQLAFTVAATIDISSSITIQRRPSHLHSSIKMYSLQPPSSSSSVQLLWYLPRAVGAHAAAARLQVAPNDVGTGGGCGQSHDLTTAREVTRRPAKDMRGASHLAAFHILQP